MILSLWNFRHFISSSIRGELKARFARSYFGGLWFVLHPLAQAVIYALVLSEVLCAKIPGVDNKAGYAIYLMAGMAAWSLFSDILNRSTTIFIEYASLLKKISFPRICLPVVVLGTALINHLLLLLAIAVVFVFFGHFPSFGWFTLIPGILLISIFAFGIGILLGVFNVFCRDVGQVTSIVIQIWFWLTPIVYPIQIIPQRLKTLVCFNPFTPLARLYQDALLYNNIIDLNTLTYPLLIALAFFGLAFFIFHSASHELVDAL
jgi:lipopolysaccharide transport system permease protein